MAIKLDSPGGRDQSLGIRRIWHEDPWCLPGNTYSCIWRIDLGKISWDIEIDRGKKMKCWRIYNFDEKNGFRLSANTYPPLLVPTQRSSPQNDIVWWWRHRIALVLYTSLRSIEPIITKVTILMAKISSDITIMDIRPITRRCLPRKYQAMMFLRVEKKMFTSPTSGREYACVFAVSPRTALATGAPSGTFLLLLACCSVLPRGSAQAHASAWAGTLNDAGTLALAGRQECRRG